MMKTKTLVLLFSVIACAVAQTAPPAASSSACGPCIRAEEGFLASDALRGRGSGTDDEHLAATYLGSELRRYGIAPAGDDGGYVQTATITRQTVAAPPTVAFAVNGQETRWTHGQQMIVRFTPGGVVHGPLQKIADASAAPQKGAVVLFAPAGGCGNQCAQLASQIAHNGAAAVLSPAPPAMIARWEPSAARFPQIADQSMGATMSTMVALRDEALKALSLAPDGTEITIATKLGEPKISHTWNAVGILRGEDPDHVVLLTAHLDHLGVGQPVNGDAIYNGADDDASGCVAVLELAHALGAGPRPKRTVVFVMFGSEEKGGLGSQYWLAHPTVPLPEVVANLEFEMIGRPDPLVKPGELWLTGWERSDLGPELARHGAKLVQDPRPGQNFFARSDNIVLARQGVVAQTVSSFGLHPDYHRPSDDLQHLDFSHMEQAIGSMIEPVRWLVNSDFVPHWSPGGKP